MSTKVFENSYTSAQLLTVSGASIQYKAKSSDTTSQNFPLYASGITIQYTRNAQPFNPINKLDGVNTQLLMVGMPAGQITMQSVLTPFKNDIITFLGLWGKSCEANPMELYITPFDKSACNGSTSARKITIKGILGTGVTFDLRDQGGIVVCSMPISGMFSIMELD